MFELFTIIYFTPFYFPNGKSQAKNKYYIPILDDGTETIFACLPTSKDSVPDNLIKHGCVTDPGKNISCYIFEKGKEITEDGFSFPSNTFIYAYNLSGYSKKILSEIYVYEDVDFEIIGKLKAEEIKGLIDCIKNSPFTPRRIKKKL